MTDYDATLRNIYQDFAAFGATRGASMPMMDGPKFAKFAKDCKLLDKTNLTATDVDLIFAKAKSKTERRITYDQFYTAVSMMADKRYPDQTGDGAFEALMKKIITSQGPTASSATVSDSSGIYGKLTDSSLYTGSHKERFNTDGSGKGLEGRDKVVKGTGSNRGVAPVNFQFRTDEDPSPPVSDDEESNEALAEQVAQLDVNYSVSKTPEVNSIDYEQDLSLAFVNPPAESPPVTPVAKLTTTRGYLHTPHPKNISPISISTPSPPKSSANTTPSTTPPATTVHSYLTPTKSAAAKTTPKYTPQSPLTRFTTFVKLASPASVAKSKSAFTPGKPALQSSSSSNKSSPARNQPMTKTNSAPLSKTPSKSGGAPKVSIFDKLTDSSQYTGSHKNRFNTDGSGRGLAGRDSVRKGGVSGQDLSQMVRRS